MGSIKWFCVGFVIVIIVAFSVYYMKTGPAPSFESGRVVDFSLLGESDYDPTYWVEIENLVVDSPITWWEYYANQEQINQASNDISLSPPQSIDFNDHAIIVSFGRKIVLIETQSEFYGEIILRVTFEEEYQGYQAFYYQVDPLPVYVLDQPCYVLIDGEPVYLGHDMFEVNEYDTSIEGYHPGI